MIRPDAKIPACKTWLMLSWMWGMRWNTRQDIRLVMANTAPDESSTKGVGLSRYSRNLPAGRRNARQRSRIGYPTASRSMSAELLRARYATINLPFSFCGRRVKRKPRTARATIAMWARDFPIRRRNARPVREEASNRTAAATGASQTMRNGMTGFAPADKCNTS